MGKDFDFERSKYDSSTEEDSPIHGLIIGVLLEIYSRRGVALLYAHQLKF